MGIIVGRKDLVAKIRRNPLLRALRVDKLRLAALSSVLRLYANPATLAEELPALRLLSRSVESIEATAQAVGAAVMPYFARCGISVRTVSCESQVGSGAHPLARLRSAGLSLSSVTPRRAPSVDSIARQLRELSIPVVGRIEKDRVVLDLRCLEERDHALFVRQLSI